MAIFAVMSDAESSELGAKIAELYPNDESLKLSECHWLISAEKLTQALAEELGAKTGQYGRVLVLRATASGAGWQRKSVWEWLSLKAGPPE